MATYAGIALVSGATLLLELAVSRLFAVQQFYHFAFMAISLALLGAGASGSLLAVWPRRWQAETLCIWFCLSTIGGYLAINYLPFDSFSIAWDGRQLIYLTLYFLAAAIPFLFSGLLIGSALIAANEPGGTGSHKIYGANLIGAAAGSLSSLPALAAVGGTGAVLLSAVLAAGAGLLFELGHAQEARASRRIKPIWQRVPLRLAALTALLLAGTSATARPPAFLTQRLSPYKGLSVLSHALDTSILYTSWDASARIDVLNSSAIHIMPGLSLSSPLGPPPQAGLTLDGDNLMPVNGLAPGSAQASILADNLPSGLTHRLRPESQTLVIESGTGSEVLFALASGARHVTAVEDNALVVQAIQEEFRQFTSNLYSNDRVTVVNQSGRVYVRQEDTARFDIVMVALTDPHRPVTSGAYSLTENYVYTVEAVVDYLNVLAEDGLLMITRWLQTPPSESARTFGLMAEALARTGRQPHAHLIAFRTLRTMTIIATAHPVRTEELEQVRAFLNQRGFDPVYFPGIQTEELNQYNVLPEPTYHMLFSDILQNPEAAYASYRFEIAPPTDNQPFFFHYFKWRQTPEILAGLGLSWQPFGGSGFFVLVALLILVGAASAVFIIGPLIVKQTRRTNPPFSLWRIRLFLFFSALGLAFLFVEIPLAQRFILILEQPVTALAVVIFGVLLFSGIGSLTMYRWRLAHALTALIVLIFIYPLLLGPATDALLGMTQGARVLFTILLLAPLGYLMGIPFASGLRLVEKLDPAAVPWAWAINGSFSVISAVLAVIVAITWGYSTVLWMGAGAYTVALLAFGRLVSAEFSSD